MLTQERVAEIRRELETIKRGLAEGLRGPITVKWERAMAAWVEQLLLDREDLRRARKCPRCGISVD